MKKSKRMQPLLKVAQSKQQNAAVELGHAQTHLQMQINRLQELTNYKNEYLARFQQSGQTGIPVNKLQSFRNFLSKLETAVDQQKQAVKSARELVERRKQQWLSARDQVKIYDNVITRFTNEEIKQADKQEQKESDERAQRILK